MRLVAACSATSISLLSPNVVSFRKALPINVQKQPGLQDIKQVPLLKIAVDNNICMAASSFIDLAFLSMESQRFFAPSSLWTLPQRGC